MSYSIRKEFIQGLPREAYRKGISAYEGVVAHSTATPEATDERELAYFKANWKSRKAFAHYFVDWDSITQMADDNYKAWGAGNGNPRYVHVELCETKDAAKFKESYKRYVWLLATILKKKNLGVTDGKTLVSHAWVSDNLGGTDHRDPIAYLKSHGVSWDKLVADVKAAYNPKPTAVYKTIDKDDTFWSLENNLKLKHGTIQKLNPKVDPTKLHEGQKIRVK
ncbi:N-acetylmuramoyl-L-alanine amidase [Neobacillus drentensis]|uniref:N-acetylmuramoyl-L-alanine amidase n=1 Tax=Neobacillus drentensis TaxID=220684 RepID=UPI003000D9B8